MRHSPPPSLKTCRMNAPGGPKTLPFLHRLARNREHSCTQTAQGQSISAPAGSWPKGLEFYALGRPVAPTSRPVNRLSPRPEAVAREGSRRDLALLTLALGTGLRLRELVGLNVGDVATKSGEVAWKVHLPKGITKGRRGGRAF